MSELHPPQASRNTVVATAWAAAALAAAAVAGLVLTPSLQTIWINLLILSVAAVPQAALLARRQSRALA